MYIIAVISQKGGTGKTTIALNLAVASELSDKPTVVIDLDPQASAKGWHDHRGRDAPVVISAQAARLAEVLETARTHGAEFVIIDTAPHSESTALAAARAADMVLIPCRPGILDLRAITTSADLAQLANKRGVVVLNAVPPRGSLAGEAAEAVVGYGLQVAPSSLGQRAAFMHSLTSGLTALEYEPKGKAAHEVQLLHTWVCHHVDTSTPALVGEIA